MKEKREVDVSYKGSPHIRESLYKGENLGHARHKGENLGEAPYVKENFREIPRIRESSYKGILI